MTYGDCWAIRSASKVARDRLEAMMIVAGHSIYGLRLPRLIRLMRVQMRRGILIAMHDDWYCSKIYSQRREFNLIILLTLVRGEA